MFTKLLPTSSLIFSENYYFSYFFYIYSPSIKKNVIQIKPIKKTNLQNLKTGKTVYGLLWINKLQNIILMLYAKGMVAA